MAAVSNPREATADEPVELKGWQSEIMNFVVYAPSTALSNPLHVTRVLMQVGYEPVAPRPGTNFFGKSGFFLPGILGYTRKIRERHGWAGLFTGFVPRYGYAVGFDFFSRKTQELLRGPTEGKEVKSSSQELTIKNLGVDLGGALAGLLVMYPLEVVSTRMIVQLVGGETLYNSTIQSLTKIFREEGLAGLYKGIEMAIACEVTYTISIAVFSEILRRLLKKYVDPEFCENDLGNLVVLQGAMVLGTKFFYPFNLAKHILAVNNVGLAGGNPPFAREYKCSFALLADLWDLGFTERGLLRGNSILFPRFTPDEALKLS